MLILVQISYAEYSPKSRGSLRHQLFNLKPWRCPITRQENTTTTGNVMGARTSSKAKRKQRQLQLSKTGFLRVSERSSWPAERPGRSSQLDCLQALFRLNPAGTHLPHLQAWLTFKTCIKVLNRMSLQWRWEVICGGALNLRLAWLR